VTGQARLVAAGTSSVGSTITLTFTLYNAGPTTLRNLYTVLGPIRQLSGRPVTVLNSDFLVSSSSSGGFIYTSTQTLPLVPGAVSAPRGWQFSDPSNVSFAVPVTIYGVVVSGHVAGPGGAAAQPPGRTVTLTATGGSRLPVHVEVQGERNLLPGRGRGLAAHTRGSRTWAISER
jgi:hypothetical protein